jgi:dynein heavy chain
MSDLFPGVEPPVVDYGKLQVAIETELDNAGLQRVPSIIRKSIQCYESKLTRHGNMLVGASLGGKTTSWTILSRAMSRLCKEGALNNEGSQFQSVRPIVINPKAVPSANLYGEYDLQTFEWTDGVLAKVMREVCMSETPEEKWLLLDGPVDTLWIESMNTVLDDNKLLTLINGERIAMPPQVSLLFEVEDLSVASPATVSRAGMVYVDDSEMGWQPYVDSWLAKQEDSARELLRGLIERALPKVLGVLESRCRTPVAISELGAVRSLCTMFSDSATKANGVDKAEGDTYVRMIERIVARTQSQVFLNTAIEIRAFESRP